MRMDVERKRAERRERVLESLLVLYAAQSRPSRSPVSFVAFHGCAFGALVRTRQCIFPAATRAAPAQVSSA